MHSSIEGFQKEIHSVPPFYRHFLVTFTDLSPNVLPTIMCTSTLDLGRTLEAGAWIIRERHMRSDLCTNKYDLTKAMQPINHLNIML